MTDDRRTRRDRSRQFGIPNRVSDSGPGLAPDMESKLFVPYSTTKESGMGLGLSISKTIIEAHGGRLWFTANDSHGSTFHFALPKAP